MKEGMILKISRLILMLFKILILWIYWVLIYPLGVLSAQAKLGWGGYFSNIVVAIICLWMTSIFKKPNIRVFTLVSIAYILIILILELISKISIFESINGGWMFFEIPTYIRMLCTLAIRYLNGKTYDRKYNIDGE